MDKSAKKFKFTYHWFVFLIGFLMVFTALGFGSSTSHAYKSAIKDDVESGLTNVFLYGFGPSVRYIATAVLNVFFGFFVAKFGPRKLIGAGFTALTISFIINSLAREYWHLYVGFAFLGIGLAWTTTTIVSTVVEKWFTSNKGTVMGIMLASNGLGGALSEVIINPMCNSTDGLGWRAAYQITALIFIAVGTFAVIFIRNSPSELGMKPLGSGTVSATKKRGADWVGFEMNEILRKPYFYVCAVCIFLTGSILQSMGGASKVCIFDAMGKTDEIVNWVSGVFVIHSLVLMAAKIFAGFSFDHFGIRFTFGYCSVFAVVSILSLAIITKETSWLAWVYSIGSSIALPLETILIPLLVSEIFGKKCHAKIMGYYLGINIFGYAVGGPLADFFRQYYGSYDGFLNICTVLMVITAITVQITFVVARKDRNAYEKRLAEMESAPTA